MKPNGFAFAGDAHHDCLYAPGRCPLDRCQPSVEGAAMTATLAVVDPAYSSWSLRGWLLFRRFGLPVTVERFHLGTPELASFRARFAPARTVPALRIEGADGPLLVWDSLAIAETLAERHPEIGFWPADPVTRALARSLAAEMHASFRALRDACPMNVRRAYVGFEPPEAVLADIERIETLWAAARARRPAGPWLFGDYCVADAFFSPVATRIATYGLPVASEAAAYVAAHLADPAFLEWRALGLDDPVVQPQYELDLPERPWPEPAPA
jgi:glutathione S-transferase